MIWQAMTTPITLPQKAIRGLAWLPTIAREVPFAFPLRDGQVFVRGALDVVFEFEDRWYWLDWKSDELAQPTALWAQNHIAQNYWIQVVVYSKALQSLKQRGGAGGAGSDGPFLFANSGLFRLMIQAQAGPRAAALLAVAH